MNVGSVSSPYNSPSTQAAQRTPEAAEVKKSGRDNDGDADDSGASTVKSAPTSTVNANGQKIGQIINATA